ncbi:MULTISPECIES: DNA translocase FtsK [unclassified Nitratiruptor]|uniref:FtsK/SpoIIIE family DNA translocase n=1 Tax=unclassified Nitratiruptor TaxID=2624044 RepID=UPI0019157C59|nr:MULTISPECIES: DNA translocase FtsK [unclassified Nitratiruptor]BCD60454.1 DNA segregation ATPase FtsK/SpoIIIE, S-DNA-T family [Nitratiruptor sp. YY08-10]BCD64057.1 DNA segregation ATPase FtsK/SpoIIIE, S-DNA-T family [Nitratiruptor sp. YY08-14]
MKQILFLIVAVLFVYLGVSTIFSDFHFVGKLGATFGKYNRFYFGLLSYIYPFVFLLPLWVIYRQKVLDRKKIAYIIMGTFILFFSLVLLQALLLPHTYNGAFGRAIVDMLTPYIGSVGVWLLLIVFLAIAYIALIKDFFEDYIEQKLQTDSAISIQKTERAKKTKSTKKTDVKKEEKSLENVKHKETKKSSKGEQKNEKEENTPDTNVKIVQELEENKKLLEDIELGDGVEKPKGFRLPSIDFLQKAPKTKNEINEAEIDKKVKELIDKLKKFKIEGDVVRTYTGPLVTTFEFKPAPHIKVSKILNLADDLAMALKAQTIRIQAPIPGKDVVGIEIPNKEFQTIYLREIIESDLFKKAASPLTLALGKDIVGKPFITDLKKLPHLLIAGTTGSGKSVGINAMVISLLYRNAPEKLKLMMIDPKMLEFSIYNDIPHLLTPVITSSKQAVVALSNMVGEMERRYQLMSQYKTKNIESFNKKAKKEGISELPYIVVIIDELADLMMTSGKDVEYSIARLAQMARASGIHLIVATQRPSVDVVTGLIKANLPARISFRVGQKIDSKVILDSIGAESLLGRGDMLFTPPGSAGLIRLHAPWISEQEIETIVQYLKEQQEPEYDEKFLAENIGSGDSSSGKTGSEDLDELFEEAKQIVLSERKTSISYLQRRLQIGYNRAARIVEQLENMGVLSSPNAKGNRDILI